MLRIGDFSKLSRISIRMLRHYDEIGILHPKSVDDFTGYRYYSESQLPLAGRIQALKNLGFGLSVIKEILVKYEDVREMERFLLVKRKELEEEALATRQKLMLLDSTLKWIRKDGSLMDYNVTLKTVPERYVASVRQVIPAYDQEGLLWRSCAGSWRDRMCSRRRRVTGWRFSMMKDIGNMTRMWRFKMRLWGLIRIRSM